VDVDEVLVALEHAGGTAAVCWSDGWLMLTRALGTYGACGIEGGRPAHVGLEEGRAVQGGLLPEGAVAARATDRAGDTVDARVGGGAWIVVLDADDAAVCFADVAGAIVRPPVPAGWAREPVPDADEACPACGASSWEQITANDESRGMSGHSEDDMSPTPFVACTRCGHEICGGAWFGVALEGDEGVDPAEMERWIARAEAAHREEARGMLARARFDIHIPEGLVCTVDGWGGDSDATESISVIHGRPGEGSWLSLETERDPGGGDPQEHDVLTRLSRLMGDQNPGWPADRSQAALTVWLDEQRRTQAKAVGSVACARGDLRVDGVAQPFLVARAGERWVAVRRHGRVTLTVTAVGISMDAVHLRALAEPAAFVDLEQPLAASAYRPVRVQRSSSDPSLVADLAAAGPLADIAGDLAALARPCLRAQQLTGVPGLGASKLGGAPDLPADVEWPMHVRPDGRAEPMRFVAQFALAGLDPAIWPGPHEGLLTVFHHPPEEEADLETARVLHLPAGSTLAPRAWPTGLDEAPVWESESPIDLVPELALPHMAAGPAHALEPFGFDWEQPRAELADAYHELLEALLDEQHIDAGPARILGWPWFVHDDVMAELVLDHRGFEGRDDDDGLAAEAAGWISLLSFWDGDTVATTIGLPAPDLAAGRFDRVRAGSQI